MGTYKIVFKGQIKDGHNKEKLKAPLCKFLKVSIEKADILFSGKAFLLKKGLSEETAQKLHASLDKIGLVSHLIYEEAVTEGITTQHEEAKSSSAQRQAISHCPHCGGDLLKAPSMNEQPNTTSTNVEVKLSWRTVFDLFDRMGGPSADLTQMKKSETYQNFTFSQKMKVNFSIWGFVFVQFYYFYRGMWAKSFLLISCTLIIMGILNLLHGTISATLYNTANVLIAPVLFGTLAKYDYYRLKVVNEKMYKGLPEVFSNGFVIFLLFVASVIWVIGTDPALTEYIQ